MEIPAAAVSRKADAIGQSLRACAHWFGMVVTHTFSPHHEPIREVLLL